MKLQDRLAKYAVKTGRVEVPYNTKKYRVFEKPGGLKWFIGKAGAVRIGCSIEKSISATGQITSKMMMEEL